MKKITVLILALTGILLMAAPKPFSFGGNRYDTRSMSAAMSRKKPWQIKLGSITPAEYKNYSAVYLGNLLKNEKKTIYWQKAADLQQVMNYLNGGGTIVVNCSIPRELLGKSFSKKGRAVFGFASLIKVPRAKGVVIGSDNGKLLPDWQRAFGVGAGKLDPKTEVYAWYIMPNGKKIAAATRFAVGKGQVWWISPSLMRLENYYRKSKKSLGEPDDVGNFIFTAEGNSAESLKDLYFKAFSSVNNAAVNRSLQAWGDKPLGAPGTISLPDVFKNRAKLRRGKPVYSDGIILSKGKTIAAIYVPAKDRFLKRLAAEIKYHLDSITGKNFVITSKYPAANEYAVIVGGAAEAKKFGIDFAKLERDTAILKTSGNHLLICGTNGGASYAVTVFLESLGCRYLWPGKDGKVIPRSAELIAKDIPLNFTSVLKIRNIRAMSFFNPRWAKSIAKFNFTPEEMSKLYNKHAIDHPGNRGFLQWHGVTDAKTSYGWERNPKNRYEWGHAFNDYYDKYGKKFPDYFALQPDGRRSKMRNRPTFCLANKKFSDLVAANIIQKFKDQPAKQALSICLNDGGYSSPCLCIECRKLDPANAPRHGMLLFQPTRRTLNYVSLTDRVLDFSNRVAEKVTKEFPGKQLTFYAYANYVKPPVKVKPHKSLIILCVAGNYERDDAHRSGFASFAAWSNLENPLLWRPNALYCGRTYMVPVNYGRKIFNDLETLKVNRIIGTDFDGLNYAWACNAWSIYSVSKAHWNFEALDYDTVISDFCKHGFGKAASAVAEYLNKLEEINNRVAAESRPFITVMDEKNIAALNAILAKAEKLAAQDQAVLRRIEFLKVGMKHAKAQRALWVAKEKNDPAYPKMRQEFFKSIHDECLKNPLTVNPLMAGFYNFAK